VKRALVRKTNMRLALLVGVALAACGGARPAPVTIASAKAAPVPATIGFAASGQVERELAALRALDAAKPETRPARTAREIELLTELSRCGEARALAGEIATKGDADAKRAEAAAVTECDRLEGKPTHDALARMRVAFHEARRLEATEPARAEKLYAEAWADAPSVAAMLGLARAARAAGDAALAERSFERALGFVERDELKATVAVTPGVVSDSVELRPLDVRSGAATFATAGLFLRQDLKTGALRVLAAIPPDFRAAAATDRFALLAPTGAPTDPPRLLEIGVDDELTAASLDALAGADELALSADGAVAAARVGASASVMDLATGKLVAKTALAGGDATLVGITTDHDVVLREASLMCVLSPPSYGACRADPALHAAPSQYAAPPVVVGRRVAFLDGYTTMRVYDVHDGRVVRDIPGRYYRVSSLELSPDGATLVSTSSTRGNYVWNLATGTHVVAGVMGGFDPPVWADDSKSWVVSAGRASLVYALPARTLVAAGALPGERRFAFGPHGALWVAGDSSVSRVDLARRTLRTFPIDGRAVDMVLSPDESLVAIRAEGATTGEVVEVYDATGNLSLRAG